MSEGSKLAALVRWLEGWDEKDAVEAKLSQGCAGDDQVAEVYRVKRTAEDSQTHGRSRQSAAADAGLLLDVVRPSTVDDVVKETSGIVSPSGFGETDTQS